ncbi:hypothetical protein [Frankia sp. Cj3]|uniref:hypothetical protein n=1 Tax=Frankia sp. Cj3 TaxID=2880976 RepID=UPI001EF497B0|nr:hypothetical protein [Frankia sp. Cj3]
MSQRQRRKQADASALTLQVRMVNPESNAGFFVDRPVALLDNARTGDGSVLVAVASSYRPGVRRDPVGIPTWIVRPDTQSPDTRRRTASARRCGRRPRADAPLRPNHDR